MTTPVYILGGAQTDFARHWQREGGGLFEMLCEVTGEALRDADIEPGTIEAAHVGNFIGEITNGQGQLGGLLAAAYPEFHGLPIARHEAACASGSMAILAATAELEAGRYDCILVTGLEQERHLDGATAAKALATAAWADREALDAKFCWPALFDDLADEYDRRYGLDDAHLRSIAELNLSNAKHNPLAQTRDWQFPEGSFDADEERNPVVERRLRKIDSGRFTDGAAAVVLINAAGLKKLGRKAASLPVISGWGHRTATMKLADKFELSRDDALVFPHVRAAIEDSWRRAGIGDVSAVDVLEVHDCFSMTEYMIIDHFGITPPGESHRAVTDGRIARDGDIPINPGGGLLGLGHPVGATGVRMLWDCARQVNGTAGAAQIDGAQRAQTLNIGGSATTVASFVVSKAS